MCAILSAAHLIDGELFQATEHKFTFSAGNLKAGDFKPTAPHFLEQLVQFCADTIISTRVIYVKAWCPFTIQYLTAFHKTARKAFVHFTSHSIAPKLEKQDLLVNKYIFYTKNVVYFCWLIIDCDCVLTMKLQHVLASFTKLHKNQETDLSHQQYLIDLSHW